MTTIAATYRTLASRGRLAALALAGCLFVLPLAACGQDNEEPEGKPIPRAQAQALERQLDSIQDRFDFGGPACADISSGNDPNTTAVQQTLDTIPADVGPDVRAALRDSFQRLFALVREQCAIEKEEPVETTEEEPVEPETTETAPPETETTETTPPQTETTEEPPAEQPTTPVEPGQGQGQGEGQGQSQGQSGEGGGALVPEDDG